MKRSLYSNVDINTVVTPFLRSRRPHPSGSGDLLTPDMAQARIRRSGPVFFPGNPGYLPLLCRTGPWKNEGQNGHGSPAAPKKEDLP